MDEDELVRLNQEGRHIITELEGLKDTILGSPRAGLNHQIYSVGKLLKSFIKGEKIRNSVLFIVVTSFFPLS